MISRKSAMAIANAYTNEFSSHYSGTAKIYRDSFYDFLYKQDYEPWFCNMVKHIHGIRELKEWLLRIHTGESFVTVTANWSWEQRKALGQAYLKNLARDYIILYRLKSDGWTKEQDKGYHDDILRHLEIDGYVFRDGELYQPEVEVLDVEAEIGLLEKLHKDLGLADKAQTFQFLQLAEDHYVHGRWSDSIANARKFFEAILQQVASKHSIAIKKTQLNQTTLLQPVSVRTYLQNEGIVEKKEREMLDKFYGLLSHTGSHPYMAEQDQARLLRQMSLTMTQFIMLRLEGALAPKQTT